MKAKLGKENITEGNWLRVSGCEKDDSQNCFIVPVEKRDNRYTFNIDSKLGAAWQYYYVRLLEGIL